MLPKNGEEDWVKPGAVVIDVGSTVSTESCAAMCGFVEVKIASYIAGSGRGRDR
ncbi:MAG: hypothetical protein ACLU99_00010 [Alphaproteobacteria bacterium]